MIELNNISHYMTRSYSDNMKSQYGDFDIYISCNDRSIREDELREIESYKEIQELSYGMFEYLTIQNSDVYAVGLKDSDIMKKRYGYKKDLADDEVAVTNTMYEDMQLHSNHVIEINNNKVRMNEVVKDKANSINKVYICIMNIDTFQKITKAAGYNFIAIKAATQTDVEPLMNHLASLNKSWEIHKLSQEEDYVKAVSIIEGFIQFVSVIVAIIASLLIANSYGHYFLQSSRVIQIIRCIGGTAHDIKKMFCVQSYAMVGISGVVAYFLAICVNLVCSVILHANGSLRFHYLQAILITISISVVILIMMRIFISNQLRRLPNEVYGRIRQDQERRRTGKKYWRVISGCLLIWYISIIARKLIGFDVFVEMIFFLILFLVVGCYHLEAVFRLFIRKMVQRNRHKQNTIVYIAMQLLKSKMSQNKILILAVISITIFSFVSDDFKTIQLENSERYYKDTYIMDYCVQSQKGIRLSEAENMVDYIKKAHFSHIFFYEINTYTLTINNHTEPITYYMTSLDGLRREKIVESEVAEDQIIMNRELAKRLNLREGDSVMLPRKVSKDFEHNRWVTEEGKTFVIGELMDLGNYDIIMDVSNESYLKEQEENIEVTIFLNGAKEKIEDALSNIRQSIGIKSTSYEDSMKTARLVIINEWNTIQICKYILASIIGLGLIQALHNIMKSRQKEYYVLHSIGVAKRKLFRMIYYQNMLYVSSGVMIGILFSLFIRSNIVWCETNRVPLYLNNESLIQFILYITVILLLTVPEAIKLLNHSKS